MHLSAGGLGDGLDSGKHDNKQPKKEQGHTLLNRNFSVVSYKARGHGVDERSG